MAHPRSQDVWADSLVGRLIFLLFHVWDHSRFARTLKAIWHFWRRLFAGSVLGSFWFANWPASVDEAPGWVARVLAGLNGAFTAVGARLGLGLRRQWNGSWIVSVMGQVKDLSQNSLVVQLGTGYAKEIAFSPLEQVVRTTAPEVYLLGAILGLLPVLPSATNYMVVGVWGVALLWVIRKWATGDNSWRGSSAIVPFSVLMVFAALSTYQSAFRHASVLNFLLWITAFVLFLLLVNMVRSSRDAAVILGPVLIGASLMALWGVYQYFRPPQIDESWVDIATSGELVRVFAGFGNPNYLAEYMALFLPLGIALWLQSPQRRAILAIPLGLMGLALVLTYSRGGWLAFIIAMVAFLVIRYRRYMLFLVLGALAAPLLAPATILRRFSSAFTTVDTSNLYRLNVWRGVYALIQKNWFLGTGLGADAFVVVYQQFMLSGARAAHAHNTYLQMAAEMGIFGFIAVIWTLLVVIGRTGVVGANPQRPLLIAAVPAALIGLLFHGLVEHIWYNPKLLFAFWAVAGLGMGLTLGQRKGAQR
jgi:putative inorganic carbon (HCO3(-)) transporter